MMPADLLLTGTTIVNNMVNVTFHWETRFGWYECERLLLLLLFMQTSELIPYMYVFTIHV